MRERYTYEIATAAQDGLWTSTVIRDELFSRDARSIARALLEQWIIGHPERVTGGERVIVYGPAANVNPGANGHPDGIVAKVRIRVYRGGVYDREPWPAAVAYLGHAERDYPSGRALGRGGRSWSRLRLPRPRTGERTPGTLRPVRENEPEEPGQPRPSRPSRSEPAMPPTWTAA